MKSKALLVLVPFLFAVAEAHAVQVRVEFEGVVYRFFNTNIPPLDPLDIDVGEGSSISGFYIYETAYNPLSRGYWEGTVIEFGAQIGEISSAWPNRIASSIRVSSDRIFFPNVVPLDILSLYANHPQQGEEWEVGYTSLTITAPSDAFVETSLPTLYPAFEAIVEAHGGFRLNKVRESGHMATVSGLYTVTSLHAAVVPEPGEWLMMIAGLGLTGLVLRKRSSARA